MQHKKRSSPNTDTHGTSEKTAHKLLTLPLSTICVFDKKLCIYLDVYWIFYWGGFRMEFPLMDEV